MRDPAFSTQHSAFSCRALGGIQRVVLTLKEILREIFDEAAYARFLARHQLTNSPAAYAHFMEERDPARKPRCC
jgi:hypothetical protein